ncbi:hypothetical protein ACF08M_05865 [Streptomyces sp. NPDC015032]|uniref:hypothetical protein n=1 Tax=Streptomyces sp. NPDC015032 TaxID=3364937 RepID=UPI0036F99488
MNCDLMVGADVGLVNTVAKEVHRQLYPQHFTGSQVIEDVGATVSWDVKKAPVFDLSPAEASEVDLRARFASGPADGGMTEDEVTEHVAALRNSLSESTFQVRLNQVRVTVDTGDGKPVGEDVAVTVQVQATASDTGLFSLNPFRAAADAPGKVDRTFLDRVVLPNVLDRVRTVLSGIALPAPQIPGLPLSVPIPVIRSQQAAAALNLPEHGMPKPPFPDSWPSGPFFALLGHDTVERVTKMATAYLEGKTFPARGQKDVGVGSAYYKAAISIHHVQCEVVWDNGQPAVLVHASVSGSGSAGINWWWGGSTDAFFDLHLEPDPTVTLALAMQGTTLKATAVDMTSFGLKLVPTRNDIVSLIFSWVVDALSSTFGDLVRDALRGVEFEVGTFPAIPVDVAPVRLDVMPTDLVLARFGDALAIEGNLAVTQR